MSLEPLTCPFCGSVGMGSLPNKTLHSGLIITPYFCTHCERTVQSGPVQIPQKPPTSDPTPKPGGD
jgi:hypothetical protein